MRIPTLLQKISSIAEDPEPRTMIDVDLMLDYTRVLYADLLEWRSRLSPVPFQRATPVLHEPTLDELTQSMYDEEDAAGEPIADSTSIPSSDPRITSPNDDEDTAVPSSLEPDHSRNSEQDYVHSTQAAQIPTEVLTGYSITKHPQPVPSTNIPPSRDIRSQISINEKYQYMSELFGNDKAAYEAALDTINVSADDESAIKWLQERLWVAEEQGDIANSFYALVRQFKG